MEKRTWKNNYQSTKVQIQGVSEINGPTLGVFSVQRNNEKNIQGLVSLVLWKEYVPKAVMFISETLVRNMKKIFKCWIASLLVGNISSIVYPMKRKHVGDLTFLLPVFPYLFSQFYGLTSCFMRQRIIIHILNILRI